MKKNLFQKLKGFIATAAAVVMAAGLTVAPVSAASITIKDNDTGDGTVSTEYHYYELLKASISGTNVSYYLPKNDDTTALKNALDAVTITQDGSSKDVFTFTQSADGTQWNVTSDLTIGDNSEDAKALAAALNTDAIKTAVATASLANGTFQQDNSGSVKKDELDPGYYLITSNLGSALVLQTLNDVEINTKNEYITTTKTADKTNMKIGDIVTYTITVGIPATTTIGDTITVHDTMDAHLQGLKSDGTTAASANADYGVTAKVGTDGADVTLTAATPETNETWARSFTVTQAMVTAKTVTFTFKAKLLNTAAADTAYPNTAYSNTAAYKTVPSTVYVYTFDFKLNKTFSGTGVDGTYTANFELRTNATDASTALYFTKNENTYTLAASTDEGATKTITAAHNTPVTFVGLDDGTYHLVETSTHTGYKLLTEATDVVIADTTTNAATAVTHTVNSAASTTAVSVVNNPGSLLPSTGGVGTTMFYVIGMIVIAGAATLLIVRKKRA